MSITKPYTFQAGTKARAAEVNADFDTLYSQVNTNISDIAQNASDITSLDNNKANINGSASNRFAVADPVSSSDAVNKQTLFKQIGNSIDYIGGLTIEKDSGSPNDTILVNPGACYDSTQSIVLKLDLLTTKQNDNQGASTTYYVYIIGNSTGSNIDILISTSSTTPTLPTGYTLYRQIGYYTTNSSANIDTIYNIGNGGIPLSISNIVASYINGTSGYLIYSNGYCEQWGLINVSQGNYVTVNFLKSFANTNYCITSSPVNNRQTAGDWGSSYGVKVINASSFKIYSAMSQSDGTLGCYWKVCGYIS